jgi:hypothetical protein
VSFRLSGSQSRHFTVAEQTLKFRLRFATGGVPSTSPVQEIPLYTGDLEDDLTVVARNRMAEKIAGGLSITEKMPCPSWGL